MEKKSENAPKNPKMKEVEGKKLSEQRARSKKIKEKVFEFEKRNLSKLVLYVSIGEDWWKMGGHSALIYHNVIAPRMRIDSKLREDKDLFSTFKTGVVSIHGIENFIEKMKNDPNTQAKVTHQDNDMVVLELKEKFTAEDIKRFEAVEKVQREMLNKIIDAGNVNPKLAVMIIDAKKAAFNAVRKMAAVEREIIGRGIYEKLREMAEIYYSGGNLVEIGRLAKAALFDLKNIQELEVWELPTMIKVGKRLAEIRELVRTEYGDV